MNFVRFMPAGLLVTFSLTVAHAAEKYPNRPVRFVVPDELNVPCVPEYRVFKNVHRYIIQLTQTDSKEVKFNFIEREKLLNF